MGSFGKEDEGRRHRHGRGSRLRRRHEAADQRSTRGVIEDAKFKTYGCGSAIASSSLVTEWVKGKTVDQALSIKNTEIAEELAFAAGEDTLFHPGRRCHQGCQVTD